MTVTLTNPSVTDSQVVRMKVAGSLRPLEARGRVLTDAAMNAANTFDSPDRVHPVPIAADVAGDALRLTLPPKCVAALDIRMG